MRTFLMAGIGVLLFISYASFAQTSTPIEANKQLATVVHNYYEDNLKLNPIMATLNGDNRYNDLLYNDLTDSFRTASRHFSHSVLRSLQNIKRESVDKQDQISYDILKRDLELNLEGLSMGDSLLVFNQFVGLPTLMALLGSGTVIQPFKTVKDYDNWLHRAAVFPAWTDSAVVYFRKGISQKMVLPKTLVAKMISQMKDLISTDPTKSTFYGPVAKFPDSFSTADKQRLTTAYTSMITEQLNPSFQKLRDFLQTEYLPKARSTSGYSALPSGARLYDYYIRYYTTTLKSADEIFNLGLAEVARIQNEMEKVKNQVGYKGTLKHFLEYMRTDPKFFPYKTPEEVLDAYRAVQQKITPNLKKLFNHTPKTPFEIRQTEAFRAATSSIEYFPGSYEEHRPGIFYVPVVDPTKMVIYESTFAHEAIPGHHYQIMLQFENMELPSFRRFGGNSAYMEGWALYVESLGKELGLYGDPYQYMRALSDGMLRAVRLVVDPGLHAKSWTREQAIKYMLDHIPMSEQEAESEIERYMANPGQALSYKIGEQKIKELRAKYAKQLGSAFHLAAFHDELLKDGAMPLDVLERKMDTWAKQQKRSF